MVKLVQSLYWVMGFLERSSNLGTLTAFTSPLLRYTGLVARRFDGEKTFIGQ